MVGMLDTLGSIGEIVSWIGLGFGLPALLIAMIARARVGEWQTTEIVLVEEAHGVRARWYAADDFHERRLTAAEASWYGGGEAVTGFVSARRPHLMRFEPRHTASHTFYIAGITLSSTGFLGLVLSFLPLFAP